LRRNGAGRRGRGRRLLGGSVSFTGIEKRTRICVVGIEAQDLAGKRPHAYPVVLYERGFGLIEKAVNLSLDALGCHCSPIRQAYSQMIRERT